VIISTLPEIDEETLPKWENMKRNKKYSCYICGKKNMKPMRYNEHVHYAHQADLVKPAFGEFCEARALFESEVETATPEERKTLYCDYDSEKEKRYSEMESEEESNSDDNTDKEVKTIHPSRYSPSNTSSTSSSESSPESTRSIPKRKRTKKKSSSPPSVIKSNTEEEMDFRKQEECRILKKDFERLSSENKALKEQSEINKSENLKTTNKINKLSELNEKNIEDNFKTKEAILKLTVENKAALKQIESERSEATKVNNQLTDLITKMESEILARDHFLEDMKEKYNILENELNMIKNKSECSTDQNHRQSLNRTTKVSDQSQLNDINNTDLAVKGQTKNPIILKEQSTHVNSVLNTGHKDPSSTKLQQSSNATNPTKVIKQSLSEIIIRGTVNYWQLLTKEIFKVIFSMIENGMGWAILAIIFFMLTPTNATVINSEEATSLETPRDSPLGPQIMIYGTATLITKQYIKNISSVEQNLNEEIITVEEETCKSKYISSGMEYLKQNESNKIQSMATYETPCTGNIMIIILITITWITLNHRCSENGKIIYPTKDIKIAKNKLDEMVKNEIESNNPQPSDMITDQPPNPFNIFPVVENISNSLNKNLRRKLYKLAMKHKPTVEPEISKFPETEDNINPTSNTIDEKEIDVTEDVMKIMTLNAIFSTPSEDMTLDPTEVKSVIETNKTETHQIKK
jgi:hypothetical protein